MTDSRVKNWATNGHAALAAIVEGANEAIIGKDVDGTITSWNAGAERLYGYSAEEVVGRHISLLAPPDRPDDIASILSRIQRGEAVEDYETTRVAKDGRRLEVSITVSPVRDASGRVVGASTIARDVTQRKQAEESIRLQAAALREQSELLDLTHDSVMMRDMDGTIRFWNKGAERNYGWTSDEAVRRNSHDLLSTEFPGSLEETMATLLREHRWEGELIHRTKDGRRAIVASRWSLRLDAAGNPDAVLEINNDITDRKAAEEALSAAKREAEAASREKTEFLSRMSHELRTPLNAILGFSQLLTREELSDDHRESVEQILKAGRHLLDLINEVLDIARIESGRLALSLEPVAVEGLVKRAVDLVGPLAGQRRVAVDLDDRSEDGLHVRADAQRLLQVLINLLNNAVKYNRDEGTVTVRWSSMDDRVRVEVADTGIGIPAKHMQRLFMPFDRLGAEATATEGSGVGLALSKRLVEAMGGVIGAESVEGQGSTFWIELPSGPAPLPEDDGQEGAPATDREVSGTSGLLLYVEDNLVNLGLMRRILRERPDVRVLSAMQGSVGLDMARDQRPDVVLLDLHLPDIPGREVLARLRADPRTAEIPVVILTADAHPNEERALIDAGARAYMTKPLDVDTFLEVIDEALPPRRGDT